MDEEMLSKIQFPKAPAEFRRPLKDVMHELHGEEKGTAMLQRLEDYTGPDVMVPKGWWTR
jgi:hypothetical protein